MNNSATGGYLAPQAQTPPFGGLTFEQFLQNVFVGVSGLKGNLVRQKWQQQEPDQPDINTNWLSIGLSEEDADTFAYTAMQPDQSVLFERMEALSVQCTFYGPQALAYMRLVRDNFQIPQNFAALQNARMVFVSTSKGTRAPDIVNERWCDRWEMTVYLRAQVLRTYPILSLVSGSGVLQINDQGAGVTSIPIAITESES